MDNKWSVRQRVLAVLEGRKPDRLPFIDRMDFWYKGLSYQGRIPEQYAGKKLAQDSSRDRLRHGRLDVPVASNSLPSR